MIFTGDFETTNDEMDCRIWSFGLCEIGNTSNFIYGYTMDEFMEFFSKSKENHTVYFHNLAFDGEFMFYWLFENGFTHIEDKRNATSKSFTTLISDKGQFYTMTIYFKKSGKKTKKVTIIDSLKLLNFSVDKIAKDFNLPIRKLEIDYNKPRPKGYVMTEEEIEYLKCDVEIMARALEIMFKKGLDRMTIASNALREYKKTIGEKSWEINFPPPIAYDSFIREKAYKGGYCFLQKRYKNKTIGDGIVLDVNSLYPWAMRTQYLPIGEGIFYEGEYKKDKLYPLYVQRFSCQFELKKDHLPTIQIKNNMSYIGTEYLESSMNNNGYLEEVELCLTSVDLQLFFDHYNVYNIVFIDGYKFKSSNTMFNTYIDYWIEQKKVATETGNKSLRTIAKLMLNALYGRFALNPEVQSKIPYIHPTKNIIKFRLSEKETREPIYIPMGAFITAYAREKTIRTAQRLYDRFIYADTDSLHLEGLELPSDIEIHPTKLGAWDFEFQFEKGKYLRQKCYMERGFEPKDPSKIFTKVTCAGMPERCHKNVDFDNFNFGEQIEGKLYKTRVYGGIVLKENSFTIKRGL